MCIRDSLPSGPGLLDVGVAGDYNFVPVRAATGHEAAFARYAAGSYFDGAESGAGGMEVGTTGGYEIVQGGVTASGSQAFHLAHPQPVTEMLTISQVFLPSGTGQISFRKRLGWANTGQVASLQSSSDHGLTWVTRWSQRGTGSSGNAGFSLVTIPLSSNAGQELRFRFVYAYESGEYYPQTTSGVGLYLDDIAVTGCGLLADEAVTGLGTSNGFQFIPDTAGIWLLRVRALVPGRTLPWGPTSTVLVSANAGGGGGDPGVIDAPSGISLVKGRRAIQITWTPVSGATGYRVERRTGVSGAWESVGSPVNAAFSYGLPRKPKHIPLFFRVQTSAAGGTLSGYSAEVVVTP